MREGLAAGDLIVVAGLLKIRADGGAGAVAGRCTASVAPAVAANKPATG